MTRRAGMAPLTGRTAGAGGPPPGSKWRPASAITSLCVMLPATLPGVFDTLRVTMGWAWTYLIVAELVAADAGLGYMSLQGMRGFDSAAIFVAIFVIVFLGLFTDLLFKLLKDRALPWTHVR